MVSENIKKVTVIVDKTPEETNVEKKGRTCFWKVPKVVEESCKFEYKSLSEYVEKYKNPVPDIFDIKKNQFVIVNQDVLNGDPLYDADKAFHVFQHYLTDIDIWVKAGGILLVECQEGSRRLRQEVYNLLGGELGHPIVIQDDRDFGDCVHINENLKIHPLLKGIDTDEYEVKNNLLDLNIPLYPPDKSPPESMRSHDENLRWRRKIHVGWFDIKESDKDWEPIIFAKDKAHGQDRPVMLCRTVKGMSVGETESYGAYIITSMFIGESGWSKLIENIVNFNSQAARNAYDLFGLRRQAKRRQRVFLVTIGILGAASLAAIGIFYPGELGPLFGAAITGIGAYVYRYVKKKLGPTT